MALCLASRLPSSHISSSVFLYISGSKALAILNGTGGFIINIPWSSDLSDDLLEYKENFSGDWPPVLPPLLSQLESGLLLQ